MKIITVALLALAFILSPVINARAACTLDVIKKKPDAKTATINGVSVNQKLLEALSKSCALNVRQPSIDELIALEQAASAKRIAKLKAKAN
jgi:hypothetical protein